METQLTFDSKAKQLNLAFKERFVTDSNFQLKITGGINTKTGKPQMSHQTHSLHRVVMTLCLAAFQQAEDPRKSAGKLCCGWLLQVQLSTRAFWASSSLQSQGLAADTPWQQTRSSFGLVQVAQPSPSLYASHIVQVKCQQCNLFAMRLKFLVCLCLCPSFAIVIYLLCCMQVET